jgi:hypothetical protein
MTKETRKRSIAAKQANYVKRIVKAWHTASSSDLASGLAWYTRAQDAAKAIHPNVLIGAGVISALSPRTEWTQNKKYAASICRAQAKGLMFPPSCGTRERTNKAWKIANLENPTREQILAILNGPKTQRFFLNIIGDSHAVTIDIWAQRVATGKADNRPPTAVSYVPLERAYQIAASQLNVPPSHVQAAVWVYIRGSEETRVKANEVSFASRLVHSKVDSAVSFDVSTFDEVAA